MINYTLYSKPLSITMNVITNNQSFCVAAATKVLGDRWTPKILVALINGEKHYTEIAHEVTGISPRSLSHRLSSLVKNGVLIKKTNNTRNITYTLTKMGKDLYPILVDMVEWGKKYRPN